MAKLELAGNLRGTVVTGGLDFLFGIEDAEEAFSVDQGVVDVIENALQLGDRCDDVAEEHHVVHDLTDRHAGVFDQDQVGRQDDDQDRADLLDETLDPIIIEGHLARLHLVLGHPVLDVQLLVRLDPLTVEALDDVDGINDILDALALGLDMRAHLAAPALETFCLPVGDPEIDRHDPKGHETHIDVGGEHQDQRKQGAGEERQQVDEEVLHRPAETADALVDTRLKLARRIVVGVEEGHPEGQHLLDDAL